MKESGTNDRDAINALLLQTERALLRPEGLPHRPWFRHQITAPGMYTGYGAKTLPAIREAIEAKNWTLAGEEIPLVASVVEREAGILDSAAVKVEASNR
jgi:N-acetylated-alpha-linked acidic dipeptidase